METRYSDVRDGISGCEIGMLRDGGRVGDRNRDDDDGAGTRGKDVDLKGSIGPNHSEQRAVCGTGATNDVDNEYYIIASGSHPRKSLPPWPQGRWN